MNDNHPSDEELMAKVMAGDDGAVEALYDRYATAVMGLAFKIVHDRALAEEIVQETFWRVWDNCDQFSGQRGHFRSWMFRIAHNLAIDMWRRRKVRPQPAQSEQEVRELNQRPASEPGVAEATWIAIQRQRVRNALDVLPAEQRTVIELSYFEGLTRKEIATVTETPLGTVHTRARLALHKLREALSTTPVED